MDCNNLLIAYFALEIAKHYLNVTIITVDISQKQAIVFDSYLIAERAGDCNCFDLKIKIKWDCYQSL